MDSIDVSGMVRKLSRITWLQIYALGNPNRLRIQMTPIIGTDFYSTWSLCSNSSMPVAVGSLARNHHSQALYGRSQDFYQKKSLATVDFQPNARSYFPMIS